MVDSFKDIGRSEIISARKSNRSIKDLVFIFNSFEPLQATYTATIHVLRLCSESNLPFTINEIKRYCKKAYYPEMGGDSKHTGYTMTLRQFIKDCLRFAGKHKIRFEKVTPSKKSAILPLKRELESPIMSYNYQGGDIYLKPKKSIVEGGQHELLLVATKGKEK